MAGIMTEQTRFCRYRLPVFQNRCGRPINIHTASLASMCQGWGGHPAAPQNNWCEDCRCYDYYLNYIRSTPNLRYNTAECHWDGCRMKLSRPDAAHICRRVLQVVAREEGAPGVELARPILHNFWVDDSGQISSRCHGCRLRRLVPVGASSGNAIVSCEGGANCGVPLEFEVPHCGRRFCILHGDPEFNGSPGVGVPHSCADTDRTRAETRAAISDHRAQTCPSCSEPSEWSMENCLQVVCLGEDRNSNGTSNSPCVGIWCRNCGVPWANVRHGPQGLSVRGMRAHRPTCTGWGLSWALYFGTLDALSSRRPRDVGDASMSTEEIARDVLLALEHPLVDPSFRRTVQVAQTMYSFQRLGQLPQESFSESLMAILDQIVNMALRLGGVGARGRILALLSTAPDSNLGHMDLDPEVVLLFGDRGGGRPVEDAILRRVASFNTRYNNGNRLPDGLPDIVTRLHHQIDRTLVPSGAPRLAVENVLPEDVQYLHRPTPFVAPMRFSVPDALDVVDGGTSAASSDNASSVVPSGHPVGGSLEVPISSTEAETPLGEVHGLHHGRVLGSAGASSDDGGLDSPLLLEEVMLDAPPLLTPPYSTSRSRLGPQRRSPAAIGRLRRIGLDPYHRTSTGSPNAPPTPSSSSPLSGNQGLPPRAPAAGILESGSTASNPIVLELQGPPPYPASHDLPPRPPGASRVGTGTAEGNSAREESRLSSDGGSSRFIPAFIPPSPLSSSHVPRTPGPPNTGSRSNQVPSTSPTQTPATPGSSPSPPPAPGRCAASLPLTQGYTAQSDPDIFGGLGSPSLPAAYGGMRPASTIPLSTIRPPHVEQSTERSPMYEALLRAMHRADGSELTGPGGEASSICFCRSAADIAVDLVPQFSPARLFANVLSMLRDADLGWRTQGIPHGTGPELVSLALREERFSALGMFRSGWLYARLGRRLMEYESELRDGNAQRMREGGAALSEIEISAMSMERLEQWYDELSPGAAGQPTNSRWRGQTIAVRRLSLRLARWCGTERMGSIASLLLWPYTAYRRDRSERRHPMPPYGTSSSNSHNLATAGLAIYLRTLPEFRNITAVMAALETVTDQLAVGGVSIADAITEVEGHMRLMLPATGSLLLPDDEETRRLAGVLSEGLGLVGPLLGGRSSVAYEVPQGTPLDLSVGTISSLAADQPMGEDMINMILQSIDPPAGSQIVFTGPMFQGATVDYPSIGNAFRVPPTPIWGDRVHTILNSGGHWIETFISIRRTEQGTRAHVMFFDSAEPMAAGRINMVSQFVRTWLLDAVQRRSPDHPIEVDIDTSGLLTPASQQAPQACGIHALERVRARIGGPRSMVGNTRWALLRRIEYLSVVLSTPLLNERASLAVERAAAWVVRAMQEVTRHERDSG